MTAIANLVIVGKLHNFSPFLSDISIKGYHVEIIVTIIQKKKKSLSYDNNSPCVLLYEFSDIQEPQEDKMMLCELRITSYLDNVMP